MKKNSGYTPGEDSIIWDIFPDEFTGDGYFENFIQKIKNENFENLLQNELERVSPYLNTWGDLLRNITPISPDILKEWFCKTPQLSGVIYFSHSTVLSESFFSSDTSLTRHPTDRIISDKIQSVLPSAKDLTFSFPRQYNFDGFYNSWGFIRIERQDNNGNGAGVALSVVTLDSKIMELMRKNGFQHLAYLYNQCWNGSIHDYIHHLGLYTNPSFAIGKHSPMSIYGQHLDIDKWGKEMVDTFNYEYWAHRTHRLITENQKNLNFIQIINDAEIYFKEAGNFQKKLLDSQQELEYVQKIGQYLGCIYLWPLHILIHPYGPIMDKIGQFIDFLILPQKKDRILDTIEALLTIQYPQELKAKSRLFLELINCLNWTNEHPSLKETCIEFENFKKKSHIIPLNQTFIEFLDIIASNGIHPAINEIELRKILDIQKIIHKTASNEIKKTYLSILSNLQETPLQKGMSKALKALSLENGNEKVPLSNYEWIRFKTEIIVQRGLYNCWEHDLPVIFRGQPTHPFEAFHEIFKIIQQTYQSCKPYLFEGSHYELAGIHP